MKKTSVIIWLLIVAGVCAVVWLLAGLREENPYKQFEEGHYAAATPEFTKRAEQGDAKAQFVLGWIAIKQGDDARGLEWWHKASENGYASATYNIGVGYLEGKRGVETDIPLARQWLQKALAQGDGSAGWQLYRIDMPSIGQYYAYVYDNQGEIYAKAVADAAPKWLEQGILLGDKEALFWLSNAYSAQAYPIERAAELIPALHAMEKTLKNKSGEFTTEVTALRYYELLGVLYFAEADYANALINLEKSENNPYYKDKLNGSAAYRLGRIYEEGLSVESDARKARETYATTPQKAWVKDDRLAMWHLAMMQAQGRGGDVDKTSAAELLHKLESVNRGDVLSAVLEFPSAEQMDALRKAIAAP